MKLSFLGAACAVVALWTLSDAPRTRTTAAATGADASSDELPSSLARLYPPSAREPLYLERMLALSSTLSGIAADVLENDLDHARANRARLEQQYLEVAQLVPEWESRFPTEPLDALGAALAASDPARCMQAIESLGASCHDCHREAMVPVQLAYRWQSFRDVACTDPATGGAIGYVKLMRDLDLGLSGVVADVDQGQPERARAYLELFRTRFDQLEQSCAFCHAGKRAYYVDATVRRNVDALGTALEQSPLDPEHVRGLVQEVGAKSCGQCHLVHMPAAMAHDGAAPER